MPTVFNQGSRIHYITSGDRTQYPCILFIHGAGGSCASWWQNIPYFSSDTGGKWFVISISFRGWGHSILLNDDPSQFDPIYFGSDILAVLDAEGIREAALVCQSYGGYFGVRTAFEAPDRVTCLIMSNTFIGFKDPTDAPKNARPLEAFVKLKHDVPENHKFNLWCKARQLSDAPANRKSLPLNEREATFCGPGFKDNNANLYFLYTMLGISTLPKDDLYKRIFSLWPQINHPCLVDPIAFHQKYTKPLHFITSDCDGILPWEYVAYIAKCCKRGGSNVSVKYFDSPIGHSPYYEIPDEYNKHIENYLNNIIDKSKKVDVMDKKISQPAHSSPRSLSMMVQLSQLLFVASAASVITWVVSKRMSRDVIK